jgi:hypothetical protein
VKVAGFGAALAVAIDASMVRAMLLPATLRLLGGAAWWSPGPLAQVARALRGRLEPRATRGKTPRLSPSRNAPARPADAIAVTSYYCDHDHPDVRDALAQCVRERGAVGELAVAVAVFEFVRDEVPYTLGEWGLPASSTLQRREGMCTNKANLLVALLRAAGIPAAYGVMRVNARDYFGVVGPSFLTRYISPESTHVYAAAYLRGRWVKCDPSTDRDIASRTAHFCQQTQLIEWDGIHDSLDFLDPRHVYADLGLYANIDELLEKPARGATPERLALWNGYLDFIRSHAAFDSSEALIEGYRSSAQAADMGSGALRRA